MDIKDIRRIIEMMKENELCEFELEDEGFRIAIKRRTGGDPHMMVSSHGIPSPMMMHPPQPPSAPPPTEPQAADAKPVEENEGLQPVTSPMVGTFYRSPTPDADPFVSLGSEVEEDTVICIVEAMKVMNEIKAETRGIVRKILVDNASPVQFGQPLFLMEPT